MATRRTAASFLAMPATLRYLVLRESLLSPSFPISCRHASTISRPKPTPPPGSTPPPPEPLRVLSFRPGPSNDPEPRALPSPSPSEQTLDLVNTLFTSAGQQLLYSAPRFLDIPFNNLVPEVCILGRSNVGKSTLLNALGGANAAIARRINGQDARKAGLAITSPTAGCTKLMNAYAFGPPIQGPVLLPKMPPSFDGIPSERELQKIIESNTLSSPTSGRKTRRSGSKSVKSIPLSLSLAERRQMIWEQHLQSLYRPPVPRSLIVMDTPGYGLNSQTSWGVELAKYLKKRTMLRGAVVLIDAVAGVKKGDQMALALLRDHNVRTTIVLTKADKVRSMPGRINAVCLSVWDELRKIETAGRRHGAKWEEGNGWEREIWVTGAGDLKSIREGAVESSNITGARMAICKMAGLVADDRREEMELPEELVAQPAVSKIITFEEIERMMAEQALKVKMQAGGGRGRRARRMASF
ncbi:putative ribosome biogenesis gtp-binding protein [Naviculisporaceae sp. PSN 640]